MHIYRIIIQNYRNLRAFDWKPDQKLNVLFGPNGCGKSNLAEALSLVFSYYSYDSFFDPSDFYMGDENNQIIIQVWLDGIESLPTNYSQYLQHISANDEFISDDFDAESKAMLIYQLTSGEGRRHEWQFFQQVTTQDCKAQARKAVQFTWIPADREPLREIGLNSRSALYRDAQEFIAEELTRISSEIVTAANHALMESPVISEYLKTLDDLSDINLVDKYRLMLKSGLTPYNVHRIRVSLGR